MKTSRNSKRLFGGVLLVALITLGSFVEGKAQDFPTRPIEIIVGFAPGGTTDLLTRALADRAVKHIGQPIIAVNKPGAAGTLASQTVVASKPDGYTLLMGGGSETISLGHFRKLSFHPIDDFEPVINLVRMRFVLNVRKENQWNTFQEFLIDAKKNPGKYSYGSSGPGSLFHTTMLVLEKRAGVTLNHVPFKGGAETMVAVLGGHVDITLTTADEAYPLIQAGKVRPLAIASENRLPLLSNVPTMLELGHNVCIEGMKGLMAPKGTPKSVIKKLHDGIKGIAEDKGYQDALSKLGMEQGYMDSEAFGKVLKRTYNDIGEALRK